MARKLYAADIATLFQPVVAAAKTITGVASSASITTVTSAAHGFSNGDVIMQDSIVGSVEAIGIFVISGVTTNTYVLNGLASVTAYTSGGNARKVTAGAIAVMKPNDIMALRDALDRVYWVAGTDGNYASVESTLGVIFPPGLNP